ncbi:hypothetical protein [Hominibacterium faecale]|nr:hypothetical protein [Hominibacterium faecale]
MTEIVLIITITLPEPEPTMPDGAEKPEQFLTKEQPLVCRCHVRYGKKAA